MAQPKNSPQSSVALSIVIPARNEARRLPQTLARIARWQRGVPWTVEVVIADDGSRDDTHQIAEQFGGPLRIRTIRLPQPSGPGVAVRAGIMAARGARILQCDADGPVPFEDIELLWAALDRGFDVAVGSRRLVPRSVETPQPLHRIWMGQLWQLVVHQLTPVQILDTQCGFKLFEQRAAQRIFVRVQSTGFVFHVEALMLAQQLGLRMAEIPVRWHDIPGSRIRVWREPWQMLGELLRLSRQQNPRTIRPIRSEPDPATAEAAPPTIRSASRSG